jgi:hypothetical protein
VEILYGNFYPNEENERVMMGRIYHKRFFTLLECSAAIFILIIAGDIISSFYFSSIQVNRRIKDIELISIVVDNTMAELEGYKFTQEELKSQLTKEAGALSLQEKGLTLLMEADAKNLLVSFVRQDKKLFSTSFRLP